MTRSPFPHRPVSPSHPTVTTPAFATRPVVGATLAVTVLLTAVSPWYGFERDELYFRMLEQSWGYVDQPPLVPLLAHVLGSHPSLLRVPATLCAAASVVVTALIARELGADRRAQAWTAWSYAGTSAVLNFGHVLLTSAPDLLFWPLICLLVIRAELRDRPRLWLAAGAVAGLATYNRLLVALLLASLAIGLALVGPRRRLASPYVLGGAALTALIAAPNLVYQATHGWPQFAMGAALSEQNAGEVRWFMWIFLLVVLGPPLVIVWGAGLRALLRRRGWRPVRFLAASLPVMVVFTFLSGAQPHYPTFVLPVLLAAGCVVLRDRLERGTRWRWLVAANAVVAVVISLPVLPVGWLRYTPIPAVNLLAADSVGWPAYARQIRQAYDALSATERTGAVVITSNYGEAGAVTAFTDVRVYSGHNALYDRARPPDSTRTVLMVGRQLPRVQHHFASCVPVGTLDNEVGVPNEEQGAPLAVCRGPRATWAELWPRFRHLS